MTMLDLGFSGAALGAASAASGFAGDPLVCPDGAADFGPLSGVAPSVVVPGVAGAGGVTLGDAFWLEVPGAPLGLVAEVPATGGEACPLGAVVPGAVAVGDVVPGAFALGAVVPGAVVLGVAVGAPLGLGSALAGMASIIAKIETQRNCGKKADKRIV
jgi:hypothetical protein